MLTSKRMTLKPLLESEEGIHLTAYLVNRGDLIDLKSQLQETINHSYEWLNPILKREERNRFLEPLDSLLLDARIFKEMKGNIGLFRNKDSFRVLNVPVAVEQTCLVATSFHVKPLLRCLQNDQEFLLLGLEKEFVHLYMGSQDSFKLIDSILLPRNAFTWVSDWISQLTIKTKPKLFLAGENSLVEQMKQSLKYRNTMKASIADTFKRRHVTEICQSVRDILKRDSRLLFEKALLEFQLAEVRNQTTKNISQICRAALVGRVQKLIVTDEINIFGKIDKKSGLVSIHPFDLDHEDDDILDDLAQMVLSQGGEVIVAARHEIPRAEPILAILNSESEDLRRAL